jgi:DNA-directed RNA polymerase subunit L
VEVEIISQKDDRIKLRIKGEDYTLGNLLQKVLLEDEEVEGAGFLAPHPLKKEIIIQVFLKEKGDPIRVVKDGIERLKRDLNNIKETIQKELEEKIPED